MFEHTPLGLRSQKQLEAERLQKQGLLKEAKALLELPEIVHESQHWIDLVRSYQRLGELHIHELLQLAEIDLALGDWEEVELCFREAMRLESLLSVSPLASLKRLRYLREQRRFSEGMALAVQLKEELSHLGQRFSTLQQVDLLNNLGTLCIWQKESKEAEAAFLHALNLMEQSSQYDEAQPESVFLKAESSFFLARNYHNDTRYEIAETYFLKAIALCKSLPVAQSDGRTLTLLADSYLRLGILYQEGKQAVLAEEKLFEAKAMEELLKEADPHHYRGFMARLYVGFAFSYHETNRYAESEAMYRTSLDLYQELVAANPDRYSFYLGECNRLLANLFLESDRLAEAEQYHIAALKIILALYNKDKMTNLSQLDYIYNDLGEVYLKLGRFAEAEQLIRSSLALTNEAVASNPRENEWILGFSYETLGRVLAATDREDEAIEAYQQALALLRKYEGHHTRSATMAVEVRRTLYAMQAKRRSFAAANGGFDKTPSFTAQEQEIAVLLTEGLTQRAISRRLRLSAGEVKQLVAAIRNKVAGLGDDDAVLNTLVYEYKLTRRETEVLLSLRQNLSSKEIADKLYIAEETVRFHQRNLMRKLSLQRRSDLDDLWERIHESLSD